MVCPQVDKKRFENNPHIVEVCVPSLSSISVFAVRMASFGFAPEKIWAEGKLCVCAHTQLLRLLSFLPNLAC